MSSKEQNVESVLSVGKPAIINVEPKREAGLRFPTVIRGWEKGVDVLLDRPKDCGRYVPLKEDTECVVLFVHMGSACAFRTRILSWDNWGDNSRLRVKWPPEVEVESFRKHERFEAHLPCTVSKADTAPIEGEITDLSLGGCGLTLPVHIEEGTSAKLSFAVPDGMAFDGVKAIVRSARRADDTMFALGCQFEAHEELVRGEIAFFLAHTVGRRQDQDEPAGRVVLVGEDTARSTPLVQALAAKGYRAYVAPNAVDGLSRLRMVGASAVVIDQETPDLDGPAIVRVLRSTKDLRELPVFVCGGDETAFSKEGSDLSIAGYFKSLEPSDALCEAVVKSTESNSGAPQKPAAPAAKQDSD